MTNRVNYIRSSIEEMEETIRTLQEECEHEFTITKPHGELRESLVEGIYLGSTDNPWSGPRGSLKFSINCLKCSLTKDCSVAYICPKCFTKLEVDKSPNLRKEYWGKSYIYYGSLIHSCPNRHFVIVNDEWDQ